MMEPSDSDCGSERKSGVEELHRTSDTSIGDSGAVIDSAPVLKINSSNNWSSLCSDEKFTEEEQAELDEIFANASRPQKISNESSRGDSVPTECSSSQQAAGETPHSQNQSKETDKSVVPSNWCSLRATEKLTEEEQAELDEIFANAGRPQKISNESSRGDSIPKECFSSQQAAGETPHSQNQSKETDKSVFPNDVFNLCANEELPEVKVESDNRSRREKLNIINPPAYGENYGSSSQQAAGETPHSQNQYTETEKRIPSIVINSPALDEADVNKETFGATSGISDSVQPGIETFCNAVLKMIQRKEGEEFVQVEFKDLQNVKKIANDLSTAQSENRFSSSYQEQSPKRKLSRPDSTPYKSPRKLKPIPKPFSTAESIGVLETLLKYLQEYPLNTVVEFVRNKTWEKPADNSLVDNYNSSATFKRCGESLKTKCKALLSNKDFINANIKSLDSQKLLTAFKARFNELVSSKPLDLDCELD